MAGDISFYNPDFEKIYREYHRKVYNYVYWRVLQREAAEDLTADVFVAVAVNLDKFDSAISNCSRIDLKRVNLLYFGLAAASILVLAVIV